MPARGNDGLKLQEKGSSGQNSALCFNTRVCPMQGVLVSKEFLLSLQEIYEVLGVGKKRRESISTTNIISSPSSKAARASESCS